MSDTLVSIIIPSYNHAQYIEKAIASVWNQTYKNIELIIVDDGSSDDSHAVLGKYIGQPNFHIILNEKNRGQSAVLNQSLDIAKGKFISLLPSDDWYLPHKTEIQLKKFETLPDSVGVVYGTGIRYFEDTDQEKVITTQKYRGNILKQLLTEPFCVYPITPLFKRECFDKVRFDESYKAEGEALYVKLAIYYEFDYVEEPVAVMRDHTYNVGKNVDLMYEENLRYWTEFFDLPDLSAEIKKLKPVRIGRLKRLKGLEKIAKNLALADGRRLLLEAIALQPIYLFDKRVLPSLLLTLFPTPMVRKMIAFLRKEVK